MTEIPTAFAQILMTHDDDTHDGGTKNERTPLMLPSLISGTPGERIGLLSKKEDTQIKCIAVCLLFVVLIMILHGISTYGQ